VSNRSALLAVMDRAGTDDSEAGEVFRSLFDDLPALEHRSQDSWVRNFEQSCNQFVGGSTIYAYYRMLSSSLHPGLLSAVPYVLTSLSTPDAPPSFIPILGPSQFVLTWSLQSCLWAGWAVDKILGCELFREAVHPAAERLELSPLILASAGIPTGSDLD